MSFEIYHYHLPYTQAILLKQGLFKAREGLLLHDPQHETWAEVAPFPGLHTESLDDCLKQLQTIQRGFECNRSPAVAWGLQMLNHPLDNPAQILKVNALLSGNDWPAIQEQCQYYTQQGYRYLKLKVGFNDPKEELRQIQQIANKYPDLRLRLDANRCWSLPEALQFCQDLPHTVIDYLEEPFQDPGDILRFQQASDLAIAWDESLAQGLDANLLEAASVYVLKPMLLGPQLTQDLIQTACKNGQRLVFSAVFESGVGLRYLARLAYKHSPDEAAGLDTWRAFESDICEPAFQVEQGQLDFKSKLFTAPLRLRLNALTQIDREQVQRHG